MNSTAMGDSIEEGGQVAQPPIAAEPVVISLPFSVIYESFRAKAAAAAAAAILAGSVAVVAVTRGVGELLVPAIREEAAVPFGIMPPSSTGFIINALLSFTQIKSQGKPEFPFETHPKLIEVGISSLLVFGLASAAEHVISRTTSIYAGVARFVRIASLFIMIASLAALFYF